MLKNTKSAFDKVKRDFNIINYIFSYGLNALLIVYYTVVLCLQVGNWIVNTVILLSTTALLLINIVGSKKELSKKYKAKLKMGKHTARILKIITGMYTLGASIYGMYISVTSVSAISIIFTTLALLMWLMNLLFEAVRIIFEVEMNRMMEGIKADFAFIIESKKNIEKKVDKTKEFIESTVNTIKENGKETGRKIKAMFGSNK